MQWLEPFATDNEVRLENAAVKGGKINQVPWACDQCGGAVEHTLHAGGVVTSSQIGGNA